jgi:hypothetical protein
MCGDSPSMKITNKTSLPLPPIFVLKKKSKELLN